jgi:hypothetical protein
VLLTVARIRETSAQLALSRSRDLGEAVVIGHAKVLADAGHEVCVVIDDQDGQTLATMEGLAILAVEDLLLAAVQLGLLAPERLRRTYEDLIPFGSGLLTWNASPLKQQFKEWRRTQPQPAATTSARLPRPRPSGRPDGAYPFGNCGFRGSIRPGSSRRSEPCTAVRYRPLAPATGSLSRESLSSEPRGLYPPLSPPDVETIGRPRRPALKITADYHWVRRSPAMVKLVNHPVVPAGFTQVGVGY